MIGEVQRALKSIVFYFQISFREESGLALRGGGGGGKDRAGNGKWKGTAKIKAQVTARVTNDPFIFSGSRREVGRFQMP